MEKSKDDKFKAHYATVILTFKRSFENSDKEYCHWLGFDIAPVWQLRGKYFVLDNFDTDGRQIEGLQVQYTGTGTGTG